jgi:uncharacterized protein (TIGR03435 family)
MQLLSFSRTALALVGLFALPPQQPADTFEIAAIHPTHADTTNTQIGSQTGGHFIAKNATLRTLIRNAYDVLPFQIVGEPKWSEVDHFDITAKTSGGQEITKENRGPLLQNLLAERFHLKTHWETREQPVLALVVDKGGPAFQVSGPSPAFHGLNNSRVPGKIITRGTDAPMSLLASELGFRLQRFVIDQTSLTAHYDFVLHWNPDTETPAEDSTEPPLATALHEQLGLKLVPTKGPVRVLVIETAERPTEN